MSHISIKILDKDQKTRAVAKGTEEAVLVYSAVYAQGDTIVVEIGEKNQFYWMQLDDGKGASLVYITGDVFYPVPFGEKRINISPKVFQGEKHLLYVKKAKEFEYGIYRNLALNVWDQHGEPMCYPHASANVETRGESVFAALNAIDGVTASSSHGEWPYASWGINRRVDAFLRLEFGRTVEVDRIVLYTRADFPHDSWWEKGTVTFSDGSIMELELKKTGAAQEFCFEKKQIEWLELSNLKKAGDESPFPALVQIEVYGTEAVTE